MNICGAFLGLLRVTAAAVIFMTMLGCANNGPDVATPQENVSTLPWNHSYSGDPGSQAFSGLPQSH